MRKVFECLLKSQSDGCAEAGRAEARGSLAAGVPRKLEIITNVAHWKVGRLLAFALADKQPVAPTP